MANLYLEDLHDLVSEVVLDPDRDAALARFVERA